MTFPPEIRQILMSCDAANEPESDPSGMTDAVHQDRRMSALQWLQEQIASPIVPEWGSALFSLRPDWNVLASWMVLSKEHCLAAVDALLMYAEHEKFPTHSDPAKIDGALAEALKNFGNWRLKQNARQIRHVWRIGSQERHSIVIPDPLKRAAQILFLDVSDLLDGWDESMATALDPIHDPKEIWGSLIAFAKRENVVVMLDWKASPEEIVDDVRTLKLAHKQPIDWETIKVFDGDTSECLEYLGARLAENAVYLVNLDELSDSYNIAVMEWDAAWEVTSTLSQFLDNPNIRVMGVELEYD